VKANQASGDFQILGETSPGSGTFEEKFSISPNGTISGNMSAIALTAKDTLLTAASDSLYLDYTAFQVGADSLRPKLLRKNNGRIDLFPTSETISNNATWRVRTGASNDTVAINPANGYNLIFDGQTTGNAAYISGPYESMYIEKVATDTLLLAGANLIEYFFINTPNIQSWEAAYSSTQGTTVTVNKPAGVVTGDLLFAFVGFESANSTDIPYFVDPTDTPAGWNFIGTYGTADADVHAAMYYRIADGTEGADFTFQKDQADGVSGWMLAYALRISGHDPNSPIGQVGDWATEGNTALNIAATSVDSPDADGLVLGFGLVDGSDVGTLTTAGTGWTQVHTGDDGNNGLDGIAGIFATYDLEAGNVSENVTFAHQDATGEGAIAVQLVIKGADKSGNLYDVADALSPLNEANSKIGVVLESDLVVTSVPSGTQGINATDGRYFLEIEDNLDGGNVRFAPPIALEVGASYTISLDANMSVVTSDGTPGAIRHDTDDGWSVSTSDQFQDNVGWHRVSITGTYAGDGTPNAQTGSLWINLDANFGDATSDYLMIDNIKWIKN